MTSHTVLIVEDDKWLAEQYFRVLSAKDYKVTTTSHALAAIQLIDDIQPDAIILDLSLIHI